MNCFRSLFLVLLGVLAGRGMAFQGAPERSSTLLQKNGNGTFDVLLPACDLAVNISGATLQLRGPLVTPEWESRLTFMGLSREGAEPTGWTSTATSHTDSRIVCSGTGVDIEYVIDPEGLRQNFIVHARPGGSGPLELTLGLNTPFCPAADGPNDLVFRNATGIPAHLYKGLAVWDACGLPLQAHFEVDAGGTHARIIVDDTHAEYPLTVDPVSTTINRLLTSPGGGKFGRCVASAGDLNGDGYSDIVVGTPSETTGGRAYVYYGSATGIPAAPNVMVTSGVTFQDNFGLAVDGAGDVNGDGYSDLIVGASAWNNNTSTLDEGAVFVYHGSATGISTTPAIILQSNASTRLMGFSVAGLGDINGDGYSDIVTGGWLGTNGQTNEGLVWVFLGSATGLSNSPRHFLERNQGAAQFGYSVNAAGDINGDGFNDVIIGAPKFELATCTAVPVNSCDDGAIFIYHGSANALGAGLNPAPTLVFNTLGYSRYAGESVSSAGDVNGDGYSDIIIGDRRDNLGEAAEGSAFIYHGSATGLNTIPATIIEGVVAGFWMGYSVSTAGDVNGDGYADVIIGCNQFTNVQSKEGAAFLHLGSPTGIGSSAFIRYESNVINGFMGECVSTAGDVNGDGYSDLVVGILGGSGTAHIYHGGAYSSNTIPVLTRSSGLAGARLGASVANAGDINGDGFSDAIYGAPDAANGQAGEGLAYVHYGSAAGLSAAPALTMEANVAGASFGASVASAGDVNGDGYADVVIGAPNSGGTGRAYVHHGGPAGLSVAPALVLTGTPGSLFGTAVFQAGDMNADGFSDLVVGAPGSDQVYVYEGSASGLLPVPNIVWTAPVAGSAFGSSVGTAGDVNGDGFSDIIIGAPACTNGQVDEGAAYVFFGNLFDLSPTPQFTMEFNVAGRRLGTSVAGAGDMNGDGYSDIVVSAPAASVPENLEGIFYICYGTPTGPTIVGMTVYQSNVINAGLGASVAEAGDVNGDGYADIIVGAPDLSNGQANEGRAYVVLGAPGGIGTTTFLEADLANELAGSSVAGGGDVDGDGYSDVFVGAPGGSPALANEGTVRVYRGNNGQGLGRLTRPYRTDLVSPLGTNSFDPADGFFFGIGHHARSPMQRTRARLRWEVVHEGQAFSGSPITNSVSSTAQSATWTDLGLSGVQIKELVDKAPGFFRYKWRVRVEYPVHKIIDGQRFSRWFYGFASGVGDIGVLPVELIGLNGVPVSNGNLLDWVTATESGSAYFLVERSLDATDFTPVGSLGAAGQSTAPIGYDFLDVSAPEGVAYYRLRMVDTDGQEAFSPVIAVERVGKDIVLYPVPVEGEIHWTSTTSEASRAIVRDALGRTLIDVAVQGPSLSGSPVQQLATGTYTLVLLDDRGQITARSRFVKR